MDAKLVPATDADTAGFFAEAHEGRLAAWACTRCDGLTFPRRHLCPACGSDTGEWRTIAPRGTVLSWTVVTHPVTPAFEVPYVVVLVAHADQPDLHFVGRILGSPEMEFDLEVAATFDPLDDDTTLVNWALA